MTEKAEQQDILYQKLTLAVHTTPGETPSALRQALTTYVVQQDLAVAPHFAPENGIPSNLQTYVTKVRKHAYKVTDEDIEQLRKDGYSEEAIFEITLSIALGTGTKCLTRGLAAIEGASDATTIH